MIAACSGDLEPRDGAAPPRASATASAVDAAGLSLVAVGDSIPYNSPDDCPGCTGFVDQYARAVERATGERVTVTNLSRHTGLTVTELVEDLDELRPALTAADVILVGIAHNSFPLGADTPCGRPLVEGAPDWSAVDARCGVESAAEFAPVYEALYSRIAQWRDGRPTVLRTINRYDDWTGAPGPGLTPAQAGVTATLHETWNAMLCPTAEASGFACADLYHAFNGPDGTKHSGDLLARDYTHPSQRGNDLIARVLEQQGFSPLG